MNPDFDSLRLELMRPHQICECRQKADLAFLPLGILEWHGLHNPVGLDAVKVHHICCLAARKLGGGAVAPPLIWGAPRGSFHVGMPPTELSEPIAKALGTEPERFKGFCPHGGMDVQEQWLFYQRLVRMTLEQIAAFGFRSIYLCTGHGPLVHFVRPVALAFGRASLMGGQPVTLDWGMESDAPNLTGDHGGKWETSLMMAVDERSVDLGEIERNPSYKGLGHGEDAVESTRVQGEQWADACAGAIAKEARWLVENYPRQPRRHSHKR